MVTCAEPTALESPPRVELHKARLLRFLPTALTIGAFLPILAIHSRLLWARPHYHLFPVVVPAAILLANRQRPRLSWVTPGSPWLATALAIVCWALLAVSVLFVAPIGGAIAALFTVAAAAYTLGGLPLLRTLWPAWVILLLAIPLPRGLDERLVANLQTLVSRWASGALDFMGVYHAMEGNVVEVDSRKLLVDQACSGINSLFTLAFGSLFYVLWERLSVVRSACLMGLSMFWVVVGNMARIVAVVVLTTKGGVDVSTGWPHWFLGLITFGLMLALVASTDRLLAFFGAVFSNVFAYILPTFRKVQKAENDIVAGLAETDAARKNSRVRYRSTRSRPSNPSALPSPPPSREEVAQEEPAADSPVATLPEPVAEEVAPFDDRPSDRTPIADAAIGSWITSWPVAVAFGVLLVAQMMMPTLSWRDVLVADDRIVRTFEPVNEDVLPKVAGKFTRADYKVVGREDHNSWGEHSRVWTYRFGNRLASASLDYQFVGWHDLTLCYTGNGWVKVGQQNEPGRDGKRSSAVSATFYDLEGRHAYLLFGLDDAEGRPLVSPGGEGFKDDLKNRLGRWTRSRDGFGHDEVSPTYQIQVLVTGETPLTAAERAEVGTFFDEVRAAVRRPAPADVKGAAR